MPANLRFIPHPAQRNARELAPQRVRHAPAQGSLAHARRPNQAENRPFDLFPALDHRQEFQQPILYLRQPEMLLVENALGFGQVELVLGFLHPGQTEDPVQIMPADPVFRRRRRHLLQPFQLLRRDLLRLRGQRGLLDLLPQHANLTGIGVGLAQLALDGPHLFPQEKVALGLGDGGRHLALDLGAERQHFMLAVEHRQQPGESFLDRVGLKQLLPLLQAQVQVHRDQVREVPRVLGVEGRNLDLLRERRRQLDDLLELALGIAHHRRQLDRILFQVLPQLELCAQVRLGNGVLLQLNPPQPLHQNPHGVVRELEHLQHAGGAADFVHLVRQGILRLGIALQHYPQQAVTAHHIVDELDALRRFHQQWGHHSWEDNDVRQAKDR